MNLNEEEYPLLDIAPHYLYFLLSLKISLPAIKKATKTQAIATDSQRYYNIVRKPVLASELPQRHLFFALHFLLDSGRKRDNHTNEKPLAEKYPATAGNLPH